MDEHRSAVLGLALVGDADPLLVTVLREFLHNDAEPPQDLALPASAEVAKFVFRRSLADVLDPSLIVARSTLERLVVSTLRAGENWIAPLGIIMPPSS